MKHKNHVEAEMEIVLFQKKKKKVSGVTNLRKITKFFHSPNTIFNGSLLQQFLNCKLS